MHWGVSRGIDDLIEKLRHNKTAETMCILSTRTFGTAEAIAFADALGRNMTLRELLASGHPIGTAGASAFGKAMSSNASLRSLCVGDNNFGDEGLSALVHDGLKDNVGLLVLDLEYKSISSGKALCSLLQAHQTLEDLNGNVLGRASSTHPLEKSKINVGYPYVCSKGESLAALSGVHKVQDLRLGRNRLGELALEDMFAGLSQSSRLRRLDLSGNLLDAAAAKALGRALSAWASRQDAGDGEVIAPGVLPLLEYLDVSKNPLGDEGGAALFRALRYCPVLRFLSAAEAGLGTVALTSLADTLAPTHLGKGTECGAGASVGAGAAVHATPVPNLDHLTRNGDIQTGDDSDGSGQVASTNEQLPISRGLSFMSALNLSKNDLGAEGVARLAEAFQRGGASRLESLSLSYIAIGDEGARVVAGAAGESLRVIDFGGNGLSGTGVASVLSAPGLREAKLFHNACGDEGVALVLEALREAPHLETLDLGANRLSGIGFEALLPGLARCPSLRTVELGANCNDERAEAAVRESQVTNPGLDIAFRRGGEAMEGSGVPPPGSGLGDGDLKEGGSWAPSTN